MAMADLTTSYMGLNLKNPIIAGSAGLMKTLENLKAAEAAGAGAVVLKSIFEEQILMEVKQELDSSSFNAHPEAMDYLTRLTREYSIDAHLKLIQSAKSALRIPVIASIHCNRAGEWMEYSRRLENAGADALELNVLVTDYQCDSPEIESKYVDILSGVKKQTTVPVAMKISSQFTNLPRMVRLLSEHGADGLVMFNRYWNPDIDIDKKAIIPARPFSSPRELSTPLRWIARLSEGVDCDICGNTGVHDSDAALKLMMAGARTVAVCSILYEKGISHLSPLIQGIHDRMKGLGCTRIDEIRGIMGSKYQNERVEWSRTQFMKYYSELE